MMDRTLVLAKKDLREMEQFVLISMNACRRNLVTKTLTASTLTALSSVLVDRDSLEMEQLAMTSTSVQRMAALVMKRRIV